MPRRKQIEIRGVSGADKAMSMTAPVELVAYTGLEYVGSGPKAAIYWEGAKWRKVFIYHQFLRDYGTDADGNPIVPRAYYENPRIVYRNKAEMLAA